MIFKKMVRHLPRQTARLITRQMNVSQNLAKADVGVARGQRLQDRRS